MEPNLDEKFDMAATLGTRRFLERTVESGDSLYAYGKAVRNGTTMELVEGPLFTLSDSDLETLAGKWARYAGLLGLIGLVLLGAGIVLLV